MSRSWSILVPVLVLACASDPSEPPAGFSFAAGTPECGPADGPAVAIYLAGAPVESLEPSPPYIRLYVWQALAELRGRSWTLAGASQEGSAQYVTAASSEVATGGTLTVSSVEADNTIEGEVDLEFPFVGRVRGGFSAAWLPGSPMCG